MSQSPTVDKNYYFQQSAGTHCNLAKTAKIRYYNFVLTIYD